MGPEPPRVQERRCPACGQQVGATPGSFIQPCPVCGTGLRLDLLEVVAAPLRCDICPCPKTRCARHGRCQDCHAHHRAKRDALPRCLRKRSAELRPRR